jgi:Effector Associated Constant Component 1
MESMKAELLLTISPPQDADQQELDELSQQLRAAILESDADAIEPARAGAAPAGEKGEPLTLATLVVMIAPKVVEGLINIVQNWLSRHERASVTVKSEGMELMVTGEPSAEQQQVIAAFLAHVKK